jgi:GNAT superfamily N-acetyltransferase
MEFAEHTPRPAGRPHAQVRVRDAAPGDVPGYAALLAAYDGRPEEHHRRRLRARIRAASGAGHAVAGCVLVGEVDGPDGPVLAGAGRVAWLDPGGERPIPAGLYLVGLVVAPALRRAGAGSALTRARTAWALERAPEVWYFANAANRASLALHVALGYEEVTRDFAVPGVEFDGGEGVLCRATVLRSEAGGPARA